MDKVEFLLLDNENEWQEGQKMPVATYNAGLVPFEDSFVVIGGRSEQEVWNEGMWKYNVAQDDWETLDQTLSQLREGFVVMGIPDEIGNCV